MAILELCPECHCRKEDFARIKVEIVHKKTREIIEVMYGEILCLDCLKKRYKGKNRLRLYT